VELDALGIGNGSVPTRDGSEVSTLVDLAAGHVQLVSQWSKDVVYFVHTYDLSSITTNPVGAT
jgi:hypothetical protein